MVWLSAAEQKNANNHTAIRKVGRRRGDCMAGVLSPKVRDVLRPDLRVSVTGLAKTTTHWRLWSHLFHRVLLSPGHDITSPFYHSHHFPNLQPSSGQPTHH